LEEIKKVNRKYLEAIPNKRNEIKFNDGKILKIVIEYISKIRNNDRGVYNDLKETKLCDFLNINSETDLWKIIDYYEN
jgi:hypothetical protein